MTPKLELSRPMEIKRVPAKGTHEIITATERECAALAKRMALPKIHAFSARLHIMPWRGGGLKVTGTLSADLDQVSVISLEAFRSVVNFDVERYFVPAGAGTSDEVDEIADGAVDLGEITAETLGLELDPYPRNPDESFAGYDSVEPPEPRVSPFAQLNDKSKKTD
jgi:hypothetical protein